MGILDKIFKKKEEKRIQPEIDLEKEKEMLDKKNELRRKYLEQNNTPRTNILSSNNASNDVFKKIDEENRERKEILREKDEILSGPDAQVITTSMENFISDTLNEEKNSAKLKEELIEEGRKKREQREEEKRKQQEEFDKEMRKLERELEEKKAKLEEVKEEIGRKRI